jgi:hypothetical protein
MKTSEPKKTGTFCRIFRLWIAVSGKDSASTGHPARCPDCGTYFLAHSTLENTLRKTALHVPKETPAFLEHRILRSLEHRPPAPVFPWKPLLCGGAAAALLLLVCLQGPSPSVSPASVAKTPPSQSPDPLMHRVLRTQAEALMDADPLQVEAAALLADARQCIRFLQNRFLGLPDERDSAGH